MRRQARTPFRHLDKSQHFERKSLFQGPADKKRTRDRREIRDRVAEVVAAIANAGGGLLIPGTEDDGIPTGHRYAPDTVAAMRAVPPTRLLPPQPGDFVVRHGDAVSEIEGRYAATNLNESAIDLHFGVKRADATHGLHDQQVSPHIMGGSSGVSV